jgi:hypothetical protein
VGVEASGCCHLATMLLVAGDLTRAVSGGVEAQCVLMSVLQALDNMLQDKNIKRPLNLVAHGFITGQYAATWALANADLITKLVLIDVPLSKEVGYK